MEWFKFYGSKWMTDPKIISLSAVDRICFITYLCLASSSDDRNGSVTGCNEATLLALSHVSFEEGKGVAERLEKRGLIEVIDEDSVKIPNFEKRQDRALTNAERQKKYRDKTTTVTKSNENVTPCNETVTLEKRRVEKSREEKRESKPTRSLKFLETLPEEEKTALSEKYKISPKGIQEKATDLKLYCEQNGKKYKNYKSFLENAVRKDKKALQDKFPFVAKVDKPPPEQELSAEQKAKNAEIRANITDMLKNKRTAV